MDQSQKLITRFPIKSDLKYNKIDYISNLVNKVYDEAESGMWNQKSTRTNSKEIKNLLQSRKLILAEMDNLIVGSINVNILENRLGEFGMLAVDEKYRGKGIGLMLIKHAEKWALENLCDTMRLEILTPRNWKHPSKEFLKIWYSKMGYIPYNTERFELMYPELTTELVTDCDFTVWRKDLVKN